MMKTLISFWLGFTTCALLAYFYAYSGISIPLADTNTNNQAQAPTDYIQEEEIQIYEDKIILDIQGASISRYAPTGSMKPLLDEGANGIRIEPKTEKEIQTGDIISYKKGNTLIIHRVIEKGTDEKGTYYITKGDNNIANDGKIRFKDIQYKTIGILW